MCRHFYNCIEYRAIFISLLLSDHKLNWCVWFEIKISQSFMHIAHAAAAECSSGRLLLLYIYTFAGWLVVYWVRDQFIERDRMCHRQKRMRRSAQLLRFHVYLVSHLFSLWTTTPVVDCLLVSFHTDVNVLFMVCNRQVTGGLLLFWSDEEYHHIIFLWSGE